jgi:hypothetical protein
MAEFRMVEIYGIKMDSRCADLLNIVMKYAKSGALTYIVDKLATSGDSDARETRRRALELL